MNQRKGFGHWEIDLVVGRQGGKTVILTLVERQTCKSIYVLVKNKTQKGVLQTVQCAHRRVKGDFTQVFKSITADNASEFWIVKGCKRRQSAMKCTTHILSEVGSAEATKTGNVFCADFCRKERISVR